MPRDQRFVFLVQQFDIDVLRFDVVIFNALANPSHDLGLGQQASFEDQFGILGSCRILLNESVFQEVYVNLKPGQTEREVALAIESIMMRQGADAPAFPTIVAAGPNAALPHAIPTDRVINPGETIIIDMGLKLDGYCSDMTRTVVLGAPDRKTVKIIRLVRQAQRAAIRTIEAGILARDADRAARALISAAGYGKNFGHGLGHGVGLAVHESPSLNRRRRNKLQPGMVVTVEPGIYLPGWGGVRLENMVVVEEKGCTVLNRDETFLDI